MITSYILIFSLLILIVFAINLLLKGHFFGVLIFIASAASIYFIFNPSVLGLVANFLGVGRGADLLLYMSFSAGVLVYIKIQIKIKALELMITKIVRENAINLRSK